MELRTRFIQEVRKIENYERNFIFFLKLFFSFLYFILAPLEKDIYSLSASELAVLPKAPTDLEDAMNHLEKDHKFLTEGGVFPPDLIEVWIERKREEIDTWRKLITPYEFHQYLDC